MAELEDLRLQAEHMNSWERSIAELESFAVQSWPNRAAKNAEYLRVINDMAYISRFIQFPDDTEEQERPPKRRKRRRHADAEA